MGNWGVGGSGMAVLVAGRLVKSAFWPSWITGRGWLSGKFISTMD